MTINISNIPVIEDEFILKNLTIVKEGNIYSNVKFENVVITQEEQKIIKNFNYSNYYECGNLFPKQNLNFNSTTINMNDKNQNEKVDKIINNNNNNNSIIYNNEINAVNVFNSNNENIFIKNNSFTPNLNNNYANANSNTTNNINNHFQMQQSIKDPKNINLNNYLTGSYCMNSNPNYSFFKIVIKNMKIVILRKQDILVAGFFSNSTGTCLIKGYLLHIYVLYSNYCDDIFKIAKNKFKDGLFFTGFNKNTNAYFKDNSASTSPIRDKKDNNSNAKHFILNTQGNEKNQAIKNSGPYSTIANNNNNPNLIDISNFIQMMNKKFFEVFLISKFH